jgi:hypothetical protein
VLDLEIVQLKRRLATEDGNHHADFHLVGVHLFNNTIEVVERAIDHLDGIAILEWDLRLLTSIPHFVHLTKDAVYLIRSQWCRLVTGRQESYDGWYTRQNVQQLLVEDGIHKDIAWKEVLFARSLLSRTHLEYGFRWNHDLWHLFKHAETIQLLFEVLLYFFLMAGEGAKNVPFPDLISFGSIHGGAD